MTDQELVERGRRAIDADPQARALAVLCELEWGATVERIERLVGVLDALAELEGVDLLGAFRLVVASDG